MIAILAVVVIQIAVLFGGSAADTGKGDWWPTKQYSWTDILLVLITAIYTAVTVRYVVISQRQWTVLKGTLDESRRSNMLTLRAWLLIDDFGDFDRYFAEDGIRIAVHNAGKLPAIDGRTGLYHEIIRGPVDWDLIASAEMNPLINFVIGAGQKTTLVYDNDPMSEQDAEDIGKGSAILVVSAVFAYTDAIGTAGFTRLTAMYVAEGENGHFVMAPKGNSVQ